MPLEYNFYSSRSLRRNPVIKSVNYIMCDVATHDAVHDAVLGTSSLEYQYPMLWNGGFIAEEYSVEDSCQNCTTVPVNGYRNS